MARRTAETELAEQVIDLLRKHGASVATAESLTGGRLSAALTAIPGASEVFRGGIVAYATDVKVAALHVTPQTVATDGVVSASAARQMAVGAVSALGATYGVATTGVAGPDPQEGKLPGTVFLAVAGPAGETVESLELSGDRTQIAERTVLAALEALISSVSAFAGSGPEETGLR